MTPKKVRVAVCTVTFTKMWLAGTPTRIIAETLRISADRADVTRRELKLPRRESWHGSKTGHRKAYLPSESEIRQKCLEFQAGWSEEERNRRRVGWRPPDPVEARVFPDAIFEVQADVTGFLEDLADSSGG
jgi:hypothetical protein